MMDICGGQYGFISSHAANTFTLAAFLNRLIPGSFKGFAITLWVWAVMVSFSRVYLGVHYPADIFVAAIFGITVGGLLARICETVIYKYSRVKKQL